MQKQQSRTKNIQVHDYDYRLVRTWKRLEKDTSKEKFKFHATIAMKDIHHKFDDIWEYLKNYDIKTNGMCYRITLLKQGKIMYEYDLPTKRMLNRNQSLKRTI